MRSPLTGGETLSAPSSTPELALAVHRRVDGAFERLVADYQAPLFHYVRRMLRDGPDAQEVVQDTLLRAYRTLTRRYTAERCEGLALRPWLFRIARNLSRNKRRGARHERERPWPAGGVDALAGTAVAPAGIGRIETRQELERLEAAIATLPEEGRELVVLRFLEGMSYAEIARTTGQSPSALRGKVFRALQKLRDVLDRQEKPS